MRSQKVMSVFVALPMRTADAKRLLATELAVTIFVLPKVVKSISRRATHSVPFHPVPFHHSIRFSATKDSSFLHPTDFGPMDLHISCSGNAKQSGVGKQGGIDRHRMHRAYLSDTERGKECERLSFRLLSSDAGKQPSGTS